MSRLRRGIGTQPFLAAAAVAFAVTAVARQALLPVPETWTYGAELGELLYDGALAYLFGWGLHLAVVVLPRQREEEQILGLIDRDLSVIAGSGRAMVQELNEVSGIALADPPTPDNIRDVCAGVDPATAVPPLMVPAPRGARRATWPEYLRVRAADVRVRIERVQVHYPRVPVELNAKLHDIEASPFLRNVDTLTATSWPTQDLGGLADLLVPHLERCEALARYRQAPKN